MTRVVVTLPPSAGDPLAFATSAKRRGASLLELRNDLIEDEAVEDEAVDVAAIARVIDVLVSARGRPLAKAWRDAAALVDEDITAHHGTANLASHHASRPLSPDEALAIWRSIPAGVTHLKHVEPLGEPATFPRLLETRERLRRRCANVTVLAMGPLALPFRAVLAEENALDYVALDVTFSAAPGQRLLDDAVRARHNRSTTARLGIIGSGIAGSRSPRIHRAPFDRIDLPADAPFDDVIAALVPHYAGFAVTSPFKRAAARVAGSSLEAVNTLVRSGHVYVGHNTDVEGAHAALKALVRGRTKAIALGDGGATDALRIAAGAMGIELSIMKRADVAAEITLPCVWTWPAHVEPPPRLRFAGVDVAVIAYGAPARTIADRVRAAGGKPIRLGPRWLIAQARGQRALWEDASR